MSLDGRFQLGRAKTGGRRAGMPNNATRDVREFARGLVGDTSYQRSLLRRLRSGSLPGTVESLLWHYAFGKPKETLGLQPPNSTQTADPDLSRLSNEELAALEEILGKLAPDPSSQGSS